MMASTIIGTAKLDEAQLTKLRKLELELGGWVVALGTTEQSLCGRFSAMF